MSNFKQKIGFKLTIAVCATALVTISIFACINIRSQRRNLLDEVERHAVQICEAVKSSTEYDMLLNEPHRVRETIKRMGNQQSIERIRIINKAGEITHSSDAEEVGKMVHKNEESCYACHSRDRPLEHLEMKERTRVFRHSPSGPRILGIINPIYNTPSCWTAACHAHPESQTVLGVFDVTMPLAAVDRDIARGQIAIAAFALSAILALSLILGILVKLWVDIPVQALLKATEHVAAGDLGYTIEEKSSDELGMLARSFNNMTRRLSEARLHLVQSDKLASLGRLAAGIAHEINNPLTGVLTYSSFLLKRSQDRPEEQADLQVIVRETIRCREIVKNLLDFARQSTPKKSAADINEIVGRAISVLDRQLTLSHVTLVRDLRPDLPLAVVDSNQIQQVLINLIVNAADAIGAKGGTITVRTAALRLPVSGVTHIRKAFCAKHHDLMDRDVKMGGKPAVRIKVRSEGREGFIHLNPMYGETTNIQGMSFDAAKGAQFLCPECSTSLMAEDRTCPSCKAPLFAFEAPPYGRMQICTSRTCGWRRWEAIDATAEKDFIELQVSDTGCGISKSDTQRIFDPFYSTKGAKGTGLGLSVVWGIIDNHEGTIDVTSEEGAGSTFVIRIPLKP